MHRRNAIPHSCSSNSAFPILLLLFPTPRVGISELDEEEEKDEDQNRGSE
jgi:hypothetical protein